MDFKTRNSLWRHLLKTMKHCANILILKTHHFVNTLVLERPYSASTSWCWTKTKHIMLATRINDTKHVLTNLLWRKKRNSLWTYLRYKTHVVTTLFWQTKTQQFSDTLTSKTKKNNVCTYPFWKATNNDWTCCIWNTQEVVNTLVWKAHDKMLTNYCV